MQEGGEEGEGIREGVGEMGEWKVGEEEDNGRVGVVWKVEMNGNESRSGRGNKKGGWKWRGEEVWEG